MAQIRFQVNGRFAGSAARDAEQAPPDASMTDFRVRAGSAARDAEERKRAEGTGALSSGFSLRAQNGSIQRLESSERVGGAVTPSAKNNNVAAYKASESEGAARHHAHASAQTGDYDPSTTSFLTASPTEPEAGTPSILRRIFSSFGRNS
jgi:hypothetical protein